MRPKRSGAGCEGADRSDEKPRLAAGDPQTDESARSLSQCAARERVLAGAILGLAGPGQKIAGLMTVTVVRPDDLADRILDRDKQGMSRTTPPTPTAVDDHGLRCPACGCGHWRVIYTRRRSGGRLVRKRECRHCGKTVITTERLNGK